MEFEPPEDEPESECERECDESEPECDKDDEEEPDPELELDLLPLLRETESRIPSSLWSWAISSCVGRTPA